MKTMKYLRTTFYTVLAIIPTNLLAWWGGPGWGGPGWGNRGWGDGWMDAIFQVLPFV